MDSVKDRNEPKSIIDQKLLEKFNQHFDKVRGTGIQMDTNAKDQMIVDLDKPVLREMFNK